MPRLKPARGTVTLPAETRPRGSGSAAGGASMARPVTGAHKSGRLSCPEGLPGAARNPGRPAGFLSYERTPSVAY